MAFVPVPNTVQVTMVFHDADGIEAVNRYYCATESVPTETDLDDLATTFSDWWEEQLGPYTAPNWSLVAINLRAMNEEFGIEQVYTTGLPSAGSAADTALPNQVSYTITWLTGLVGRSFRGRTYGIGLRESAVAAGHKQLIPTAVSALHDRYDALRSALETAGHALQVVSYVTGGVPNDPAVTTAVIATRANFPLATQRRRLR